MPISRTTALLFFLAVFVGLGSESGSAQETTVRVDPGEKVVVEGSLPDSDGDGFPDPVRQTDACEGFDDLKDSDNDGLPDGCDSNDDRPDADGDGVKDIADLCVGFDDGANLDKDGIPDGCDPDRDNDGVVNGEDFAPDDVTVQDPPSEAPADATPPPMPRVTMGPANGANVTDGRISYGFESAEEGVTYECRIRPSSKPAPAFEPCANPSVYGRANGSYTFNVRSKDAAGNRSPQVTRTVTVNLPTAGEPLPPVANCEGETVPADGSIDERINGDPATTATTFCLLPGTHTLDSTTTLKNGDSLECAERATMATFATDTTGSLSYPTASACKVRGDLTSLLRFVGDADMSDVDVSGGRGAYEPNWQPGDACANPSDDGQSCPRAGTGISVAMGEANGKASITRSIVHGNDAVGVANAKGRLTHLQVYDNTGDINFAGFTGGAIKGITEYEIGFTYCHDEQANCLWQDHGNAPDPEMASNPGGGTWFHNNIAVDAGRWGIRYEYSPRYGPTQIAPPDNPTFLAERNVVASSGPVGGRGGASMADAQNGTYRNNRFGPVTLGDDSYGPNEDNEAIVFSDSGSKRTDLHNGDAVDNALNGERIVGCEQSDERVRCSGNG